MGEGELVLSDPILITGCARSGTSLTAGIIHLCGAFGGITSPGTRNNAKGMFENNRIRENVVKPFLRTYGVDPMGQYPLPSAGTFSYDPQFWQGIGPVWRQRIKSVLVKEGYNGKQKVFYKGAKACLMWRVWDCAFPDAKWVITQRPIGDIVDSCMRTNFMRAFRNPQTQRLVGAKNEQEGWTWWVREHEDKFKQMAVEGLNIHFAYPDEIINGDFERIEKTINWLGLEWDKEKVLSFVKPSLWKRGNKR